MKKKCMRQCPRKTRSAIIFSEGSDPETQLSPSADSYVWKLVPTGNFGSREYLYVRVIYWSYLKFDLSILPPNSTIISASLNYYCIETSGSPVVYWYKVSDDSWTEGGINWNNKPPLGDLIGTQSDVVGWNSFDITAYAQEEFVGNKLLSIGGKKAVDFHNKYYSKEGAYAPYLLINFTAPYLGYSDQGCQITPELTSNKDQDVQVLPSFTTHKDQECKIVVIYLGKDQSVKVLPEFTVYADHDVQIYALQLKKDENVRVVVCFNADQDVSIVPEFVFHLEQLMSILPGIVSNQDQNVQITRAEYLDHDVEVLPRLIIFKDQRATLFVKNYQDQTVLTTPLYENVGQPISLTPELIAGKNQEIEILPRLFGYPELTGLITPRW